MAKVGETPTSIVLAAGGGALVRDLERLDARAQASVDEAKPTNTVRAYSLETACYAAWCTRHGVPAIPTPPRALRAYLRELADQGRAPEDLPQDRKRPRAPGGPLTYGSISRALGAICTAHTRAGLDSPRKDRVVVDIMDAIAREKGTATTHAKRALDLDGLAKVVRAIPDDLRGLRDRALLVVGWWTAARRDELSTALLEHLRPHPEGLEWFLPKSKTDQRRGGKLKPLRLRGDLVCPVTAVRDWLLASKVREGRLFRGIDRHGCILAGISPEAIALRIKRRVECVGLDPTLFAGHSLRRGFVTEHRNEPLPALMLVTGHKQVSTLLKYMDTINLFDQAAGKNTRLIPKD